MKFKIITRLLCMLMLLPLADASAQLAPGSVSNNLNLWLKADEGIPAGATVPSWQDQSPNNYDVTNIGQTPYNFIPVGLNFNPTVRNPNSSNRRLGRSEGINLQTITIVVNPDDPNQCAGVISERGIDNFGIRACGPDGVASLFGSLWLLQNSRVTTSDFIRGNGGNTDPRGAWFNGFNVTNTDPSHADRPHILTVQSQANNRANQGLEIGDSTSNTTAPRFWSADIAEIVGYTDTLSTINRRQVESYLALKYGITLDQRDSLDYIASDGTTRMWTNSVAGAYTNDIAGIGRDDDSELNQKQSKSVNEDGIVTMGLNTIAASNIANTASFVNDQNFMTWSNNNRTNTWTPSGAPRGTNILTRNWFLQETGTVGAVTVQFDVNDPEFNVPGLLGGSSYRFIYDSNNDNDLRDETPVSLTNIGGGIWRTATPIDFTNGTRFTLGTAVPVAPAIQITKAFTGGDTNSFDFNFTLTGASVTAETITTTGPLVQGANTITGSTGNAITIAETAQARFPLSGTTMTCRDASAANPNAIIATSNGTGIVTIPAAAVVNASDITCAVVNTFVPPFDDLELSKAFNPSSIEVGGSSSAMITITNPAGNPAISNVSFIDRLSRGLVIAATPNTTLAGCGPGSVTTGINNITANNVTLAAGPSTCVISVQVTSAASPSTAACPNPDNTNNSSNFIVNSTNLDTSGASVGISSCLNVVRPPDFTDECNGSINITTSTVDTSEAAETCLAITRLTPPELNTVKSIVSSGAETSPTVATLVKSGDVIVYRLTTSNLGDRAGTEILTETVPIGTEYTGDIAEGWTCLPDRNANSICTHSGITIPGSGGSMTVDFTVTALSPIPLQAQIINTAGATNGTCSSCVVTSTVAPRITKVFTPDAIIEGGVSTATITLTKASGVAVTGLDFTDTLPAGLIISGTPVASQCGGTVTTTGNNVIVLTGGSMASGATSCTIMFDVTTP